MALSQSRPLLLPVSSTGENRKTEKEIQFAYRKGGGAESYNGEKAWSSRNHSILSGENSAYCANCGAMIRLRLIGNREARRAGSRGQGTVPKNLQSYKEENSN